MAFLIVLGKNNHFEEYSLNMQLLMLRKTKYRAHVGRAWYAESETQPLDLACHQSVSEYKPCTNPMEFFILRPDMKRNRRTRPVISQIASEWPAVSHSSDRLGSPRHTLSEKQHRNKLTPTQRSLE